MKKPVHVAIIMDRNGKWAEKKSLSRIFGHREGVKSVKRAVKFAAANDIKVLSLYAFSTENWLRPADEVKFLMKLLEEFIAAESSELIREGVKVVISGRMDRIPDLTRKAVEKIVNESKHNTGLILNIALDYGGQDELLHAVKKIASSVKNGTIDLESITTDTVGKNLYCPELPEVDLLIRTGGEMRVSNFMLWQISYAELYFPDVLWPDFDDKDFAKALEVFASRKRRFGKTDEQLEEQNK